MIEAPKWAKGAVPTTRGWTKGNEVLIVRKFTQEEIDEWYAAQAPKPELVVESVVEPVVEEIVVEGDTSAPLKATRVKKKPNILS